MARQQAMPGSDEVIVGDVRNGALIIGGVAAGDLAREFGTPLYVMDEGRLRDRCRAYARGLGAHYPNVQVVFASKAFCCVAMCRLAHDEGLYVDVISPGELATALRAGVPAAHLLFHGSNKTVEELRGALEAGVGRIVLDNFHDIELLDGLTRETGRTADVLLRLTPGIEPHTHKAIRTGGVDSKFGFPMLDGTARDAVGRVLEVPGARLRGLHCHIGSQIFDLEPFVQAADALMDFAGWMKRERGVAIEDLNVGGGPGVRYLPGDQPLAIETYAHAVADAVRRGARTHGLALPRLWVEPGRSIVGDAGATLYRVGAIKPIRGVRTYVSVDGGMYENPRQALYQARYDCALVERMQEPRTATVTIAGRCCESGDILIWDAVLPEPRAGDLLAVFSTGAYNYSMASNYNRYPRPAVVFAADGHARLVVRRETVDDVLGRDVLPA